MPELKNAVAVRIVRGSIRDTVLLCVCFIAMVLGALLFSVTREPTLSPEALREQGVFVLPQPRELGPFQLTDARGGVFSNATLSGQWTFVFFGFTQCPDICPVSMSILGQAFRQLSDRDPERAAQIQTILVTVDPERDDPATLKTYVQAFSDQFIGVTGQTLQLAEFARQVNVAFAKVPDENGGYTMDHSGHIVVINPRGHYHGFIKMPHTVDKVLAAYQALIQED